MGSTSLIGVDIGSSSVKMVELSVARKNSNAYRVERYVIEPLPRDAMLDGNIVSLEAVSESLRRGWKRMETRLKTVALALPAAAVTTKKIIVPAGQREDDLLFQVETEASQYIPFALDEVNLDFQVVGPAPGNPEEVEVLIAASRKEKVEDRVAVALTAGLKAVVMDVEPYAAQAAFELIEDRLPGGGKDQIIALVDIGATGININVLCNKQSVYMPNQPQPFGGDHLTREIQSYFNLLPGEAEAAKRSGELTDNYKTDVLQPFREALVLEVARALQFFFTSTQFTAVNYIFLAGGCAVIPELDEAVAARTQVDTLVANPFIGMELSNRVAPKQLSIDAPSLLVACGLALRSFDRS
ncbi:MAG: pilus assembly protein PilM [Nitrosomonadaceae bacterium]|nr:pilus assembly protein PilM [Nitrosomonadaceae bacterium]